MSTDEYLQLLREQLANGEISDEEFVQTFDDYYEGGTEKEYSIGEIIGENGITG